MIGKKLGPYEVLDKLGEGGMGEVFRARDTRLRRDVALKVLPLSALGDDDRRNRFEREAQVLASLNHPNIAQVFGVEDAAGTPVIVMELVDGDTLADRLAGGALPTREALLAAVQLCDGLEAAHDRGVVHRDLKPANIKLRPDGSIKILDFGIAKALAQGSEASDSPTMASPGVTGAGIILGTAAYMSPEQARGKVVDKRADLWAFGCVLYEMLTGTTAFRGETTTDILAAVVQREPDWTRLPSALPPRIRELLRRCLEKDLKDRQRDIGDARFAIERALRPEATSDQPPAAIAVAAPSPVRRRATVVLAFLSGLAAAAALFGIASGLQPAAVTSQSPLRLTVALPPDTTLALGRGSAVVLSPDGQRLAFTARSKDVVRLYVRPLDRFETQPLPGTEGATNPFFSPDGKWLGFFADGKIKKVSLEGGAPVVVADATNPRGHAWSDDNTILVTPTNGDPISRVSVMGGKLEPVTTLRTGELSHRWPLLLPDRALLFSVWNDAGWEPASILAQRPGSQDRSVVVQAGGGFPRYLRDSQTPRGFLVYARSEGLLAARFDEATLQVTGQAVPILDGVITNLSGGAHFDVSASGTLAYVPGTTVESERDLVWVPLDGKATPIMSVRGLGRYFGLSPDGTRLVRANSIGPGRDVWVDDLQRLTSTRITGDGSNFNPLWSSDGRSVIFSKGLPVGNLYRRATDNRDQEERLTTSELTHVPSSVSRDGKWLVYTEFNPVTGSDLWILPLGTFGAGAPSGEPQPFIRTNFSEGNAMLSPDGRWVAYQSNESGRFEYYIRSFPDGGQKTQVSTAGATWAQWAPSGREILYRADDGKIMGSAFSASPDVAIGPPRAILDASSYDNFFCISPDGSRVLMIPLIAAERTAVQINVVLNFIDELRQRMP